MFQEEDQSTAEVLHPKWAENTFWTETSAMGWHRPANDEYVVDTSVSQGQVPSVC
jgi:hypothetical protein